VQLHPLWDEARWGVEVIKIVRSMAEIAALLQRVEDRKATFKYLSARKNNSAYPDEIYETGILYFWDWLTGKVEENEIY